MKLILATLFLAVAISHAASHRPQDFLNEVKGSKTEGLQIYQHFCSSCHAPKPLILVGAPRINKPADWSKREKQGMDVMVKHTYEGFNAMPARGGCFECTDEQLLAAIQYMLQKSKSHECEGRHKKIP